MATISSLRIALAQPELYFKHLKQIVWDGGEIVRSTLFAQTHILLEGKPYMLCMPLCATALKGIEQFLPLQRHLKCSILPKMEILRDEMQYKLSDSSYRFCDILLEPLPDALPFADALADVGDSAEASSYLAALEALKQELTTADISHNNLQEENLLIDAHFRLYPIRWYYATDKAGGDDKAIERLRTKVASTQSSMELHQVECEPYCATSALDKYIYAGDMHEGLIVVESEAGWGFVDYNCEEVIKPQYLWANDFCEGRAEVDTPQGMGLIDREGNYIIEPIYDTVEFDVENGWSKVCKDDMCALFDYSGNQLSPWTENFGGGVERTINQVYRIIINSNKKNNYGTDKMSYHRQWTCGLYSRDICFTC